MKPQDLKQGDKLKNKAGLIGTVGNINGITRIIVRDFRGKICQTLRVSEINLKHFERVEDGVV